MHNRHRACCLVAVALLVLVSSCKSPDKPSVSQPQVLSTISVALDGYEKDASGIWHSAVLLKNGSEAQVECVVGSWPKATSDIPQGTPGGPARNLSPSRLPTSLVWGRGQTQMTIPMMKRYGIVQTKVLATRQSERILLPLWVTPSLPGKTLNQLMIGIRTKSSGEGPQGYDMYIAELVL